MKVLRFCMPAPGSTLSMKNFAYADMIPAAALVATVACK